MIEQIRAHAMAHYDEGGWDIVVEAYDDEQIAEAIEGCDTLDEAIATLADTVGALDERRSEARAFLTEQG